MAWTFAPKRHRALRYLAVMVVSGLLTLAAIDAAWSHLWAPEVARLNIYYKRQLAEFNALASDRPTCPVRRERLTTWHPETLLVWQLRGVLIEQAYAQACLDEATFDRLSEMNRQAAGAYLRDLPWWSYERYRSDQVLDAMRLDEDGRCRLSARRAEVAGPAQGGGPSQTSCRKMVL